MAVQYLYDDKSDIELIFCNNCTISYPLHNHVSVFVIVLVLDGSIQFITDSGSNNYYKNQIFVIFPYVPHSIRSYNKYSLLSLCIRTNAFNCYSIDKIKSDIINLIINTLGLSKINAKQYFQLLNYLDLLNNKPLFTPHTNNHFIEQLKNQIELFPENKLSIEQMAKNAFISKFHFIRNFKQSVGLTPHQFQIQNRIRKAQRLIKHTNAMTQVALKTGFYDQSHFIKQFEKHVGLTPTAYKISCSIF